MFSYEATRSLAIPLTEVRAAVGALVSAVWGGRARLVAEDGTLGSRRSSTCSWPASHPRSAEAR